jgi:catalase
VFVVLQLKNIKTTDGTMNADGQLGGRPSCTHDAIAIVPTENATKALCNEAAAVQFVLDAFGHLKAIGASSEAQALLTKAGVIVDEGVTGLDKEFIAAATQRFYAREHKMRVLA